MSRAAAQDLWFPREEFLARVQKTQVALRERGLDGMLAFEPESVTYLTGFFTRGYGSFQLALIPVDGEPTVVCRDVSEYYLDLTCAFTGRRLWSDSDDRIAVGIDAVREKFGDGARLGIEFSSWQLNAARFARLQAGMPGTEFIDVGDLVGRQRLIKSPREIEYQRRSGKAAELGMRAAAATAKEGVSEREVAAEIVAALVRAGSDVPGPGPLSSGERAFYLHGGQTDRILQHGDTVQVETTPGVRHYHARFMRTLKVGEASSEDQKLAQALIAIQDRALAEVGPGVPATVPDAVYRQGVLGQGLAEVYSNKTFYSLGLLLRPNGGEPLEAVPNSTWSFEVGMTFHTYVLARSFGFSETITITPEGYERLTNFPRALIIT